MVNFISKIVSFILKRRWMILAIISLITILCFYKLSSLKVYNELDIWFKDTDPIFYEYKEFNKQFNDDRLLIVGYRSDSLFTNKEMNLNRAISDSLKNIKGVKDVISLTNIRVPKFTLFNSYLSSLIPKNINDFKGLKRKIQSQSIFIDNLVSKDLRATAFQIIPDDSANYANIYFKTKTLVNSLNNRDDFIVVGGMALVVVAEDVSSKEPPVFLLSAIIIIIALLLFFFKRVQYAILPIIISLISIIWTFSGLTFLGGSINMITGIIPLILLATSIPFSVHFIVRISKYKNDYQNKNEVIIQSLKEILLPGFIASFTTSMALLVFGSSDIMPIRHFGILTSIGIILSFILSVLLLPVFISFSRLKPDHLKRSGHVFDAVASRLTYIIEKRSKWILIISTIIFLIAIEGISRLKFESDQVKYFKKNSDLRVDNDIAGKWFNGIYPFEVIFDLTTVPHDSLIYYWDMLQKVEADLMLLNEVEICHSANGMVDAVKNLNPINSSRNRIIKRIISDDKSNQGLRQGMSMFYKEDQSKYRLTVRTKWVDNKTGADIIKIIKSSIDNSLRQFKITYSITGASVVYLLLNYKVMRVLRTSISFSFLVIFLVLVISFKKPILFISGIIPNIFPVINTLGIMGYFNIPIDVGTVLITSISFGIAVDDTVYFINAYKLHRKHKNCINAIGDSYKKVYKSLCLTTFLLISGFIIMIGSTYSPIIYLGVFVSLNLLFALMYDTLVLPALLYVFSGKTGNSIKSSL